ncbi:MAG TPA: amidohydrolase family protein [Spirochaetota bacterium]|nr:amidohydrolase family protein [Spirochaetota bacterium]
MRIIDTHSHVFPDFLAERAMKTLSEHSGAYKPFLNGTIADLVKSMDKNKIKSSFIANIATKPEQSEASLKWSQKVRSERIIPLGSIHPSSLNWEIELENIKSEGLPGIKLHPLYQNFLIDDKRIYPVYEKVAELGLFILFHSGYDIAFGKRDDALSFRMKKIVERFKNLKIIAAHLGGWREWDNVLENLAGKDVFFETSFINEVPQKTLEAVLSKHDKNRFFFGSDSPWLSQESQIDFIKKLNISDDFKEGIFYKNLEQSGLLTSISTESE